VVGSAATEDVIVRYNHRMGWTRFAHGEMHRLLVDRCISPRYRSGGWVAGQALFCPSYVPLEGRLGADWGVIVNPQSTRFAQLTFELDDCGCAGRVERGDGPIHVDAPDQQGDMWDLDWRHECDEFCDQPCEWRPAAGSPILPE